jgi:dihydrodipicolinate synthase/N-acetylneuraminate lyase
LVNATSDEPTMLTLEERAQLVEFVIKTSTGRLPVCAGTASESLDENATLVDRFDKAGADSILVHADLLGRLRSGARFPISPASARARKDRS